MISGIPSYKLVKILKFYSAEVFCSDDYVKDPNFLSKEKLIEICDIIIIGAPHSQYRDLEIPSDKKVIDLWGIVSQEKHGTVESYALKG